jgi:hypothetical protein
MQQEFEMSLLGELTFFLGLQVQQEQMAFSYHKQNTLSKSSRSMAWKIANL